MSRGIAIYLRENKDTIYEIIAEIVEWSRTEINIYNNINSVLFQRSLQQNYQETELSATILLVEIVTTHKDTQSGDTWFDVVSREIRELYTSRDLEIVQMMIQRVGDYDELLTMGGYNEPNIIPVLKECGGDEKLSEAECPICYADFPKKDMIETECAHSFCAPCLYQCYEKTVFDKNISCPMCRNKISKLYTYSQQHMADMKDKFSETYLEGAIRGILSISENDEQYEDDDSIS